MVHAVVLATLISKATAFSSSTVILAAAAACSLGAATITSSKYENTLALGVSAWRRALMLLRASAIPMANRAGDNGQP